MRRLTAGSLFLRPKKKPYENKHMMDGSTRDQTTSRMTKCTEKRATIVLQYIGEKFKNIKEKIKNLKCHFKIGPKLKSNVKMYCICITFTQVSNFRARGHSSTTLTGFWPFLTPTYPVLTFMKKFLYCYKVKYAYRLHFLYHQPGFISVVCERPKSLQKAFLVGFWQSLYGRFQSISASLWEKGREI